MILFDPQILDEAKLAEAIDRDGHVPRIQFSRPETCSPEILAQVNACCRRFGARIEVRFHGHHKSGFDFRVLRQIPEVRALIIEVHQAGKIEGLESLDNLEELAIGVFEWNEPNFLKTENLKNLRRLALLPQRRRNIDLAPLVGFSRLEDLTLCGYASNIDVLSQLGTVRKLGLSEVRNAVRLDGVRLMPALETLWVVLGGRARTNEFANERVKRLRIDRIRGLEEIDLSGFPRLDLLCIEDQSRITTIDLHPIANSLTRLQIFNMKNLERLIGLAEQGRLESLWLGHTKIDPEDLIEHLPKCIHSVGLMGYGKKRGEEFKHRIASIGLAEAKYEGMLGM